MTSHQHGQAKKAEDHSGCSHHGDHHHKSGGEPVTGGKYDKVPEGFTGTVYTCPMHPEVRNPGPGSCPICGMGLPCLLEGSGGALGLAGSWPWIVGWGQTCWPRRQRQRRPDSG